MIYPQAPCNINYDEHSYFSHKIAVNKIKKTTHKSNTIIDKVNNDLIKESSLFSMLYNNISQKATIKTNSRPSSNDKIKEEKEKESTIIHKEEKVGKSKIIIKKKSLKKLKNLLDLNPKNKVEKKLIKHNTNNSFSIYNSILEKALNESKKKIILQNKNNEMKKNKYIKTNDSFYKIKKNELKQKEIIKNTKIHNENKKKDNHKKMNTQIDLNALTSNFNFINNEERRRNNKSLYNFGNIYFINQNQIIKNDLEGINSYNNENNNNFNYIKISNKNTNLKIQEKNPLKRKKNLNLIENSNKNNENINKKINPLNVSNTKHSPKIIMDFSKYKKKGDYRRHLSIGGGEDPTLNGYNFLNKIEYNETQLISEI